MVKPPARKKLRKAGKTKTNHAEKPGSLSPVAGAAPDKLFIPAAVIERVIRFSQDSSGMISSQDLLNLAESLAELARQVEQRRKDSERAAAFRAIPAGVLLHAADYFMDDRDKWLAFTTSRKDLYELSKQKPPAWPKNIILGRSSCRPLQTRFSGDGQHILRLEKDPATGVYFLKKWSTRNGFVSSLEIGRCKVLDLSWDGRYLFGQNDLTSPDDLRVIDLVDPDNPEMSRTENKNTFLLEAPDLSEGTEIHDLRCWNFFFGGSCVQVLYDEYPVGDQQQTCTSVIWDVSTRQIKYQLNHVEIREPVHQVLGQDYVIETWHNRGVHPHHGLVVWNLNETNEVTSIPIELRFPEMDWCCFEPCPTNPDLFACAFYLGGTVSVQLLELERNSLAHPTNVTGAKLLGRRPIQCATYVQDRELRGFYHNPILAWFKDGKHLYYTDVDWKELHLYVVTGGTSGDDAPAVLAPLEKANFTFRQGRLVQAVRRFYRCLPASDHRDRDYEFVIDIQFSDDETKVMMLTSSGKVRVVTLETL